MIVQMEAGLNKGHEYVRGVVEFALQLSLNPETKETEGAETSVVEVYLKDGKVKTSTIAEHVFAQMPGVSNVRRVTPSLVSLEANGAARPHRVKIGNTVIGNGMPCQLIAGPCTIDPRYMDELVGKLVNDHNIRAIRGGCWKPRSKPGSFTGFGEEAARSMFTAARKYGVEVVCTEVIEVNHLRIIERVVHEVGYIGDVVVWVGARTNNPALMPALGLQRRFAVMIKNPVNGNIDEWATKAEFVLSGEYDFDQNGRVIDDRSLAQGNDRILFCARGIEYSGLAPMYRFAPMHEMISVVRNKYWVPVGVDPSHSAGTMQDDLVISNLHSSLSHRPAFVLLEVYFGDGRLPLVDAKQAVPLDRLPEVQEMILLHNQQHYPQFFNQALAS